MSWREELRFQLRFNTMVCAIVTVVVCGAGLLIVLGWKSQNHIAAEHAKVQSWPKATAIILDARGVMMDASDDTSVSTEITVTGHLRYPHPAGEKTIAFRTGTSGISPLDWRGTFKPGGQVPIRYNPENPGEISFIDFTGSP